MPDTTTIQDDPLDVKEDISSIKFGSPPLVEASCEFRFESTEIWRPSIVAMIARALNDIAPVIKPGDDPNETHFYSQDNNSVIQISEDKVVVSNRGKYESWETFLDFVLEGFDAYCNSAQPDSLTLLSLRYINQIDIEASEIRFPDYFNLYPFISRKTGGTGIGSFSMVFNLDFDNDADEMFVQFSRNLDDGHESYKSYFLGLNYRAVSMPDLYAGSVFEWLEKAHSNTKKAFLGCLTQKTREMLKETR